MFNFSELIIIKSKEAEARKCGSFVGIRRDKFSDEMHFILPKGFDSFDVSYDSIKNLFFNMYKTFQKFINEKKRIEQILDNKPQSKDNIAIENSEAYRFINSDGDEVVLYSKIEMIENIVKLYKNLDIESLTQKVGLTEDIDYSKVVNLLSEGVILKNNAIVIESMPGDRNTIQDISAEIIEIYCYIYSELAVELKYDIDSKVSEIAYNFSYKYLNSNQSLFNEDSFSSTMIVLKERLDIVHRYTAYKDYSYWMIYDAIESFLYGSLVFDSSAEQGFWGINNFSQIWEDMCNEFFVKTLEDSTILYCDTQINFEKKLSNLSRKFYGRSSILIDKEFNNNFYIEFNNSKRWMRPDLVVNNNSATSFLEFLFYKKVISYKVAENNNIINSMFNNNRIELKFYPRRLDSDSISEEMMISPFEYLVDQFKIMGFRNPKKLTKKYNSLVVKKINRREYHLNGISEKDFKSELELIFEEKRKSQVGADIHCIDWKYLPLSYFEEKSEHLIGNISKQLTYEFCLYNNEYCEGKTIQSQFGIPYYIESDEYFEFFENVDCSLKNIQVCKMNFRKIQSAYLNE